MPWGQGRLEDDFGFRKHLFLSSWVIFCAARSKTKVRQTKKLALELEDG